MSDWKQAVEQEWKRRRSAQDRQAAQAGPVFPLIARSFDEREILAMVDTLLSGRLTMADRVKEFECKFAGFVGAKYAVMVNSGSSANLLALAVAANPMRKNHLKPGDEVLIPAICWSTSVWPLIQMGLKPVFVDVDPRTLNADLADVRRKITPKTRAMMAVHILGNSAPMKELMALVREHGLLLIEDTCESLGSKADGKTLGTFGAFGTYSFYFSHHLTTGEGGMVVCDTLEDFDLLKCLRAHGWTRELHDRKEREARHSDVDPRFCFVNVGYNFRPMEIQAAMGICQLDVIGEFNANRVANWNRLKAALRAHPKWNEQLSFPEAAPGTDPVWFGFPALLDPKLSHQQRAYLDYLTAKGVENRPVISGNFARQPALKLYQVGCKPEDFPGAETVHHRGFFIGLHTEKLTDSTLATLADIVLGFDFSKRA